MTESNEPVNPGESSPLRSGLLSCPFCGGHAELHRDVDRLGDAAVLCGDCGANVERRGVHGNEKVVVAWNNRVTPSESELSDKEAERISYRIGYVDGAAGRPSQVELTDPEKQLVRDWRLHQPKCHSCGGFVKVEEGGICLTCHTEGQ